MYTTRMVFIYDQRIFARSNANSVAKEVTTQTETTQTFKHAELVTGFLDEIDNEKRTILLRCGRFMDPEDDESWKPDLDMDGDEWYQTLKLPEGMTVNPSHLGTYYEFRVVDGVLDPTHRLD